MLLLMLNAFSKSNQFTVESKFNYTFERIQLCCKLRTDSMMLSLFAGGGGGVRGHRVHVPQHRCLGRRSREAQAER